jgi:hypothetical protein
MKPRAASLHEALFPVDLPEFDAIAELWPKNVVNEMLGLVWDAFDQMKAQHFQDFDFTQSVEQLERGLTDLHIDEITLLWKQRRDGFESFIPKHEAWEFRNRKTASAMPPSIDIGFVLVANRSVRWNIEAKVLEHTSDVTRYLSDLTEKYLTGKGSALSDTAALAGYLRQGDPKDVFPNLEERLGQPLELCTGFKNRTHRITCHMRELVASNSEEAFTCHHLILGLGCT